jgi:hypothetical protein
MPRRPRAGCFSQVNVVPARARQSESGIACFSVDGQVVTIARRAAPVKRAGQEGSAFFYLCP